MSTPLTLLSVTALLLLAAAASVAESAISRTSRVRAMHLAQEKGKRGQVLSELVEDPAPHLNVVVLVLVAARVSVVGVTLVWALERFGSGAAWATVGVSILATFVLTEVVPKTYTVQRTDVAALSVARPVRFLRTFLGPLATALIWVSNAVLAVLPGKAMPKGPFVTEDEIRHMVDVAEEEEEIEEDERELIHSIFEFGDTVVREVMVPRPDMVTIDSSSDLAEALDVILKAGYSRIPIFEGDNDNIVGLLYAKDLMKRMHENDGPTRVSALGRAPAFIPEQKKVSELLREMQKERVHMAIVVDEYGGTAGLVTIEDLIEEIVGEIVDEYDQEEPLVEPLGGDRLRVDAKMPIDEINELLDVELPHDEWDTVGGLVFGLVGRVPVPGETVRLNGLSFKAERVTGRRIQKVVVAKLPPEDPTPEEH